MKRKDLKKISKYLYKTMRREEEKRIVDNVNSDMSAKEVSSLDSNYMTYNEVYSNRIFKLIDRILTLEDNLYINLSTNSINLKIDIINSENYNTSPSTSNAVVHTAKYSKKSDSYSYLSIAVNQKGFRIEKDYGNSIYFEDADMFNKIFDNCKAKSEELIKIKFESLINDFMIDSKLSRGSNIDDILNDI